MRSFLKDLQFPFPLILQPSITCHKGVSRTISLWALRRYRSQIWRHRSPDMPACSSGRSSRFSPSAILSPGKNGIHRSPGNPRAGSHLKDVLCGNRNPDPDHRNQRLPSRHHCGNIRSRHRRNNPCYKHIKALWTIFGRLLPAHLLRHLHPLRASCT